MIKYTMFPLYNINVFIKNLNLDIKDVKLAMSKLPVFFLKNVEKIIIHDDELLKVKKMDSIYNNGTIEINSSSCSSIKNLLKLLIHELYHSIEFDISKYFPKQFNKTCDEYLNKKHKLLDILKNDTRFKKPKEEFYSELEYSFEFDDYLLNSIRYPLLMDRIIDLFPSPYSITSISEYIAVCVEVFFFEKREWLLMYCPEVFNLITKIEGFKNGKS